VLVVGFLLVLPVDRGGLLMRLFRLFRVEPFAAYETSLREAAIKRPGYRVALAVIPADAKAVNVVSFTPPLRPPAEKRDFDMWVALPAQLKAACEGAADPVAALQQVLGLPPVAAADRVVTEITVAPQALFRPCTSGGDIAATTCGFDLPPAPSPADGQAALQSAYDHLRFIAGHMADVYRTGFARSGAARSDYPYTGVPFTSMGWTYNWAPSSATHVGVTEFVVRRDAPITFVKATSPAEFCKAAQ
jgi:hypothetical protein